MEENSYGRLALGFAALLFMISIPMALMNFMWGGLPGGKDEIGKGLWPSGEAERRARKAPDKTKENKEKEEKEEEEEKRKKKKEKEEKEETEKPIIRKIKEAKRAKKLLNKKELVEARKVLEKLKELKESLKKYKDNKIGVDKFKKDIEEGIKWIKDEGFNLLKDLKQEIYLEEVSDELKKKLGIKTDRSGVRQLIINEKNVLKNLFNLIDLFEKLGPVPNWSEESLKNAETYLHQMYKLTEILIELNIRELAYESKERVVSEGGGEEPVVKKTVTGTGVGEKAPSEIPLVSKVRGYIQTDLEYFIRESVYTKMIYKHARYISENLDNPDLRLKNKKGLNHMVSHLDALKRQESWQQLRARFSKLEGAMKELLSLPYFKQKLYERKKIIELLRQEHVFEAGLLQKTVEELEPMIKGKNLNQMNDDDWVKIRGTAARLHRGLQALVATLQNLEKILERAVEQ
ncbi:hypothetical protein KY347_03950 [Candidatus Woesearchaeota archaeon]|nr:hypothetical protein [Candidatus Woesearchaeota archaeon]